MPFYFLHILGAVALCFALLTCTDSDQSNIQHVPGTTSTDSIITLQISFDINESAYRHTNFGEPPQVAVWALHAATEEKQTLWVTERSARNDWQGKLHVPVALPFWRHSVNAYTIDAAQPPLPNVDAVSRATPKSGAVELFMNVRPGTRWGFFLEANASADYNESFPYWSVDGFPDPEANGQPSIVWSGAIQALPGEQLKAHVFGRTDQYEPIDTLRSDISGVTSALDLVKNFTVVAYVKNPTK